MSVSTKTRRLVVSAFLGAASALYAPAALPQAGAAAKPTADQKPTVRSQLNGLIFMIDAIQRMHVDEESATNGRKMMVDAINGYLEGLDPHSRYMTAEEVRSFMESGSGKFVGIGIEMTTSGPWVVVGTPLDDSPADKAGLKPGDVITHIDGELAYNIGMNNAVSKIRGNPGTPVNLTIRRKGVEKALDFKIVRGEIKSLPVKAAQIGNDIGYVKLSNFNYQKTDADGKVIRDAAGNPVEDGTTLIRDALLAMKKHMGPNAKGYVLDLRNDPGGLMGQSVSLSDHFLEADLTVVTSKGRDQSQNSILKTKIPGDIIDGKPLIVLVNEGSASASEIVAGALQDHKRAIIMGVQTFGKGSVQTIMPLSNGDALKLTTSLYYTPSDRTIQGKGITPDVLFVPRQKEDPTLVKIREANLSHTLDARGGAKDVTRSRETCTPNADTTPVGGLEPIMVLRSGKADDELLCAIDRLRGTSVFTTIKPVAP